jgi:hypothetical protein
MANQRQRTLIIVALTLSGFVLGSNIFRTNLDWRPREVSR